MVKLNDTQLAIWQSQNLEHIRYEYEGVKHCIDIGSYRREWANEMIKRYGCTVECFDALDHRAAWTFDGELSFGGAYYYTSLFEPAAATYKCVDIAPYLEREVDVCKINIEGGEYLLLAHIIGKGLHKNIRNLQVQFHEVDGLDWQAGYDAIAVELSKTHKPTWHYPFCWENWQRL